MNPELNDDISSCSKIYGYSAGKIHLLHVNDPKYFVVKSPQIVKDIIAANGSHSNTKPSTPAPPLRSLSTDVTTSTVSSTHSSSSSTSAFKVSRPCRKYFDSGDYELARAGILSSASVGSIHPSADKLMASSSASRSARNSRDDLPISGEQNGLFFRNFSAPNTSTHLQKSTFSMASLDESESEEDCRMEV